MLRRPFFTLILTLIAFAGNATAARDWFRRKFREERLGISSLQESRGRRIARGEAGSYPERRGAPERNRSTSFAKSSHEIGRV
jgi:hypothetical protein